MTPPDAPLDRDRWENVRATAEATLELPLGRRAAYLDAVCAGDASLRAEIERLVRACDDAERAGNFLAEPAPAFAEAVIVDVVRDDAARVDRLQAETVDVLAAALVGRYTIGRIVGRGGMATVYLARDERHRRPVAIKVVHPDLAPARGSERFVREIEIVAALQHPHILPLHDSGTAGRLLYYVMPYIEGDSLREFLVRQGPASTANVVRLVREMADALAYAHSHGVVHRDLKPENVLLSGGHALITDFGVAKALAAAADDGLSSVGLVLGTPGYMAPEQASGEVVDHRADLYALGIIAYELLFGRRPTADGSGAGRDTDAIPDAATMCRRRGDLPRSLANLIVQTLRRRPADRPQSAVELVRALDTLSAALPRTSGYRWLGWRLMGGHSGAIMAATALVAVCLIALAMAHVRAGKGALDSRRVVVFPLATISVGLGQAAGEDVATLLVYTLEAATPLRWLNGADDLARLPEGTVPSTSLMERRAIARRRHAAFFIDGAVLRLGDSSVVALRLYSVAGDSTVVQGSVSGRVGAASLPELGLRAVGPLLAPMLDPGHRVDLSALGARHPAAVAAFLDGERAYRALRFEDALDRYRVALADDSLFTLAALKGAQSASWLERAEDAEPLARIAAAQASSLPAYRGAFARGLDHYLHGAADSAVLEFERVIAYDSTRAEAWMALGDTYRHLLPKASGIDSLAEHAFEQAAYADTAFVPPRYHLAEIALRRGSLARAESLFHRLDGAATPMVRKLGLALTCARNGMADVAWQQVTAVTPDLVMGAGELLAAGAAYPACARDAFRAVLASPGASDDTRWSALAALYAILVVGGRDAEIAELYTWPPATSVHADYLLVIAAAAGVAVEQPAAIIAKQLGDDYENMTARRLWVLGVWEGAHTGRTRLRAIARAARNRADSSGARGDAQVAEALAGHAALADGDTTLAIHRLSALTPTAPKNELFWYAWEGLGAERSMLARLLLARRQYTEAAQVASLLDSSHPITYLLYLRTSLAVQQAAAAALGDARGAARYDARRARMTRSTFPGSQ